MARESTIEKNIVKAAKAMGYDSFKFTSPGRRGVPDRLFVNEFGFTCFIEVKKPGGDMTPLQRREVMKMNDRMWNLATCVDNVDDAVEFLNQNKHFRVART